MYYQIFATYTVIVVLANIAPALLDEYTNYRADEIIDQIIKYVTPVWALFAAVTVLKLIWSGI